LGDRDGGVIGCNQTARLERAIDFLLYDFLQVGRSGWLVEDSVCSADTPVDVTLKSNSLRLA